ncbi:acetyl-CoA carboxylase [Candidatus Puniceispirillum marinum]|uniref:Biotin carboxyl carrier protein of acetyl-CoA carboxylase n=1 Tax=Puniceispirillum marinum (strain IMCC1322) TaxID=488538 RepID=D5BMH3_PUNMI|nr:acetyl-CoA carboxylase [Candidatus Puniceispirillum marinum]ADE40016.1 biotin/lipoyl attachment [Candidatus Puniceispirillum marinum IMCC1322]
MAASKIQSPLPGIFYRRPAPDQPNFKEVGDKIEAGDVIGLVEVMKTYTQIQSDVNGVITAFLVDNETSVTPGQVLAEIKT